MAPTFSRFPTLAPRRGCMIYVHVLQRSGLLPELRGVLGTVRARESAADEDMTQRKSRAHIQLPGRASDLTRPDRQVLSGPSTAQSAAPRSTPRERRRQVGAGPRSRPSSKSRSSLAYRWRHSRSARVRAQSGLREADPEGKSIRIEVSGAAAAKTAYRRSEVRRYARQIPVRYAIPCDGLVRKAFSVVRSGRSSRWQPDGECQSPSRSPNRSPSRKSKD
jgi:hypothetical protein